VGVVRLARGSTGGWPGGKKAATCGLVDIEGQSLQSTLQRGWYWGSPIFKKEMLRHMRKAGTGGKLGSMEEAEELLQLGLDHFGIEDAQALLDLPRADRARVGIAWAMWRKTAVAQRWIAKKVGYRSAGNVSQQVRKFESMVAGGEERSWMAKVENL